MHICMLGSVPTICVIPSWSRSACLRRFLPFTWFHPGRGLTTWVGCYHLRDSLLVEVCLLGSVVDSLLPGRNSRQAADCLLQLVAVHLLMAESEVGLEDGTPRLLAASRVHRRANGRHRHWRQSVNDAVLIRDVNSMFNSITTSIVPVKMHGFERSVSLHQLSLETVLIGTNLRSRCLQSIVTNLKSRCLQMRKSHASASGRWLVLQKRCFKLMVTNLKACASNWLQRTSEAGVSNQWLRTSEAGASNQWF